MALQFYQQQPTGYLYAAYQPIVFRVFMDYPVGAPQPALPPVVYLDIYLNGTYYRTLSKTVYEVQPWFWRVASSAVPTPLYQPRPFWNFDVSDAVQEILRTMPPSLLSKTVQPDALASIQVAVRGSSHNGSGFLIPEGPVPVQGDFYTPARPGGGVLSGITRAVAATLRPEDNPSLYQHLKSYQLPFSAPNYDILPLSHRVSDAYQVGWGQQDFISLYIPSGGLSGNTTKSATLGIAGRTRAGGVFEAYAFSEPLTLTAGTVNVLPTGPAQLSTLAWTGFPSFPGWDKIADYKVFFLEYATAPATYYWQSPVMKLTRTDTRRLIFLNAVGGWDGVSFCEQAEVQETKSALWQKSRPLVGATRLDGGSRRFNVRSTRTLTLRTATFPEKAQRWLAELLRSPQVYLIQPGMQGQATDYLPVRVLDGRIVTRKEAERYTYEAELNVQYADDLLSQRN